MPRLAAGLQCSWKQYDQDKYTDGTVPSKRRGGQRIKPAPGRPFISWFSCDIRGLPDAACGACANDDSPTVPRPRHCYVRTSCMKTGRWDEPWCIH